MTSGAAKNDRQNARDEKRAAALRANLKRRKQQQKAAPGKDGNRKTQ